MAENETGQAGVGGAPGRRPGVGIQLFDDVVQCAIQCDPALPDAAEV